MLRSSPRVGSWLLASVVASACTSFAGYPDPIPDTAPCEQPDYEASYQWILDEVITKRCAVNMACHQDASPLEDFDLRPEVALASLRGPSKQHPDMPITSPGEPERSYLMVKLGAYDQSERFGELMPWESELCREQLLAIDEWIAAGAPVN